MGALHFLGGGTHPLCYFLAKQGHTLPRSLRSLALASADILMALPSASAAFVLVISSAWPSFSAAAFRLFDATTCSLIS